MSLNFDKIGRNIAKVDGGKYNNKVISVFTDGTDETSIKKPFNSLKLTDSAKFQQIPDCDKEREILYITGPSGSGKSTYTANWIKAYKRCFRDNEVYVFSALKDDESLDVIKPKRIKIDEKLLTEPLSASDFENSCVVFDDIDVISNKKWREEVYNLMNQILETGRHFRTSCVITNHLPTAGKDTRRVLNECNSITYFPHSGSKRGLNYLLMEYIGIDKEDISKIKKAKSRWATIFKNYPQIAMTEKMVWCLGDEDD
jgi:nicotinamide riboside kinase